MKKKLLLILIAISFLFKIGTISAETNTYARQEFDLLKEVTYEKQNQSHQTSTLIPAENTPTESEQLTNNTTEYKKSEKRKTQSDNNNYFESKLVTPELISNGNFEAGHTAWTELFRSYDGNWYSWTGTISTSSGYDNWGAYLLDDEWLISSAFTLPSGTLSIHLEYDGEFYKSGTCAYGNNLLYAYIYDETSQDIVEILNIHDASTDTNDYEFYNYYSSTENSLVSRAGHTMSLRYLGVADDPNCHVSLELDNITLIASTTGTNGPSGTYPAYRFRNEAMGVYIYTADPAEISIINSMPDQWAKEGFKFYTSMTQQPGTYPTYRFRSKIMGVYIYTADPAEINNINAMPDQWENEGLKFYVNMSQVSGTMPIYRFRSKIMGVYIYTSDPAEINAINAMPDQWANEGLKFYVQ